MRCWQGLGFVSAVFVVISSGGLAQQRLFLRPDQFRGPAVRTLQLEFEGVTPGSSLPAADWTFLRAAGTQHNLHDLPLNQAPAFDVVLRNAGLTLIGVDLQPATIAS